MNTTGMTMGRRAFCGGLAVFGASAALAGCSAPTKQNESAAGETAETDIVVLGSGLAGSACALAAAQGGARVTIVEKSPSLGISFLTSKGNVSICQTVENEEFWQFVPEIPDTMDDFVARYDKVTKTGARDVAYPDYNRVRALMGASCETINWVEQIGVDFTQSFTKEQVGTDTVKPDMAAANEPDKAPGLFVFECMKKALGENGVEILLEHEATTLVSEEGSIVGVEVLDGSKTKQIRAKAIVLATGGFGGSEEYLDELVPSVKSVGFQYLGNALNTGDGISMAKTVGAACYEDGWVIPFNVMPCKKLTDANPDFKRLCDMPMSGAPIEGGDVKSKLLVDAAGERFINEASPAIAQVTAMADHDAAPYYVLFDASNADVAAMLDEAADGESVVKADTVEALAEAAGTPALVASYEAYRDAAAAGADEAFGKPAEAFASYQESGPYYLVSYVPSYVATMGGVKTDADCRVVDESEAPIEGLYAIGEIAHRFMYNRSFVRHCSNSSALSMGRILGTSLAAE